MNKPLEPTPKAETPQLKSRSKSDRSKSSRRKAKGFNATKVILGPVGLALLMVALIAGLAYRNRFQQVVFDPSTEAGKAALSAVETFPDKGQKHVEPGESVNYEQVFPTSGPHDPNPIAPGFYTQEQRPEQLVHSLEHGNIVVYYDEADAQTKQTLQSWATQFPGAWDGVVVVPMSGIKASIVLTAWTKQLTLLRPFAPDAAASFIDLYRGRGPENPVR
ncbi:MAG: hypothetical protein DCF15_01885 [Phormidesmis priestleyi]|uniref:DUF3105 domain-containing protein n=1 Tax=Phormidesmis priestleyi TaxID=268141 RepID=A0A2W4XTX4_9CYAN|nr:MAG: hypothetical protein DCF15_01885 [Phormidesmis priestleyi]